MRLALSRGLLLEPLPDCTDLLEELLELVYDLWILSEVTKWTHLETHTSIPPAHCCTKQGGTWMQLQIFCDCIIIACHCNCTTTHCTLHSCVAEHKQASLKPYKMGKFVKAQGRKCAPVRQTGHVHKLRWTSLTGSPCA